MLISFHPLYDASIALKSGEGLDRAISILDRTSCIQTYKMGLLYVAPGQTTQEQILGNQRVASPGYHKVYSVE